MGFKDLSKINIRQLSLSSFSSRSSNEANESLLDAEKQVQQPYNDSPSQSPPHSPTLSVIDTPVLSRPRRSLCSRCLHLVIWSTLAAFLLWAIGAVLYSTSSFAPSAELSMLSQTTSNSPDQEDHTLVSIKTAPSTAAPVVFKDPIDSSKTRWTISLPKSASYPPNPADLIALCTTTHEIPHHIHSLDHPSHDDAKIAHGHPGYYAHDHSYMDVSAAITAGILPPSSASAMRLDSTVSGLTPFSRDAPTCEKSLTFILQSPDAGFGPSLISLWLAYGLASKEGRAFFIDDRNWAYGSYKTFFAAPPVPNCRPPPETERVPCPHQAQHLLVSPATSHWVFGHAFEDEFEDARKMEVERQVNIFGMMRVGYEALFHLASDDAAFVTSRISELKSLVGSGLAVGMHIRHGDKHPYLQEYSKGWIDPLVYVGAANDELFGTFNTTKEGDHHGSYDNEKILASKLIVASDDAGVYEYWEDGDIVRAQDRVVLGTPEHRSVSGSIATVPLSWEGGFFANKFSEVKGGATWFGTDPGLEYKALLARSYLLDLAVIGSMDRVVCTVSSVGCRMLAVMMGWEEAIVQKKWINVDGDWDWAGVSW